MARLPLTSDGELAGPALVALGEGLAAGMGSFSLSSDSQRFSFPAQMAAQMGTQFCQPLIQPPGIGRAIGFASSVAIVPSPLQSTVLEQMPPDPPANLSIPGLTVSGAIRQRARQPLIHRRDVDQTVLNLLLGTRDIYLGVRDPLPTPLEVALSRKPGLALVELGYAEALLAATAGDPQKLPSPACFRSDYTRVVAELRSTGATVVVLTIPDPLDTAYFSSCKEGAQITKIELPLLLELWHLHCEDLITINGLNEISYQILAAATGAAGMKELAPLPAGSTLAANIAASLRERLRRLNEIIQSVATANNALVFDLNAFFRCISERGVEVGSRKLDGSYLGGFYTLNGYYPGATGHALIANQILSVINHNCGANFPLIDATSVIVNDAVAAYRPALGPDWTRATLASPPKLPVSALPARPPPPSRASSEPIPQKPLRLPPGLQQVLDLNPEASFFGDAISAQNCTTPDTIQWGSGYKFFFGGVVMMDSHLSGKIRIRFTPPVDNWTTFQVSFEEGLGGSDAILTAPSFFKMPGRRQSVQDIPGLISSGKLNLETGQLNSYDSTSGAIMLYASFFNTALFALLNVNPNFPKTPLSFPGQYGSAFAQFDQRPDGLLDFTFAGSTFVPLGNGARFPLNFCGPAWEFASVPAAGTVLHPHISLTTRAIDPPTDRAIASEIPCNTVQELTLFTAISSFGDVYHLEAPQLGGRAIGRTRLIGRAQIQFGPRSGNSVPIAVSLCSSGGLLAPLNPTPIAPLFPGKLTPGPEGFGTTLRFPLRSYNLNDLFVTDDTFDISVGALDVRSGDLIHPLLHRAFIHLDLIFALLRVEPRTPQTSFYFRGDGSFKKAPHKEFVFQCFTKCHLPYPPGYLFPDPNFATTFAVAGGTLDPYLWIWAMKDRDDVDITRSARADRILSGKGELVSYRLTIPGDLRKRKPEFVYENHSQQSSFTMHSLAWLGFGNSGTGAEGEYDTLSFSCFGVWRSLNGKDKIVQAAVQLSRSPKALWVGIQIARAEIGDADTPLPADVYPIPIS